ncbi:hypothetical protein GCM10009799_44900 [Nocardiopsis rhodophaea]|uniref:Uncharacterized protein n=1 Tax=Nocardiopsis rhodophaea TaxID=280238 RepID=A0ABP5F0R4_9ACTN
MGPPGSGDRLRPGSGQAPEREVTVAETRRHPPALERGVYRIAISHVDNPGRKITPTHQDTARTVEDAVSVVRKWLHPLDSSPILADDVQQAVNVADFRVDIAATTPGQVYRVVIAPSM